MSRPVLTITDLSISLPRGADRAQAVSDVSITVGANEIVCLVGESGSVPSMRATRLVLPGAGSNRWQSSPLPSR